MRDSCCWLDCWCRGFLYCIQWLCWCLKIALSNNPWDIEALCGNTDVNDFCPMWKKWNSERLSVNVSLILLCLIKFRKKMQLYLNTSFRSNRSQQIFLSCLKCMMPFPVMLAPEIYIIWRRALYEDLARSSLHLEGTKSLAVTVMKELAVEVKWVFWKVIAVNFGLHNDDENNIRSINSNVAHADLTNAFTGQWTIVIKKFLWFPYLSLFSSDSSIK